MALQKIQFAPSTVRDDSPYAAKGRIVNSNLMRWYRADANSPYYLQTVGGWEQMITSQVSGYARSILAYADYSTNPIVAIGTHKKLYAISNYTLYDVTPNRLQVVLNNAITTVSGSNVCTISHTANGVSVGDQVNISLASVIGSTTVDGDYQVASVVDANTYTIALAANASTSATGGGFAVFTYQLAIGFPDSIAGLGYGTGAYGSGSYGTSSGYPYFKARVWSLWQWGDRFVASVGGGGLYEFQPIFTTTEYVTNPTFAAVGTWVAGTNWSIAGSIATKVATNATALSQPISVTVGAYVTVKVTAVTVTAGSLQLSLGGVNFGTPITTAGTYSYSFIASAAGSIALTADAAFAGTFSRVSVQNQQVAYPVPNAPTVSNSMFVTPENFVVLLGTSDATGVFSPNCARWCDQAVNTTWSPTATNQARDTILRGGTRLVAGRPARGQSLIWSDAGLISMKYTGDPAFVYRFDPIATQSSCGLIGQNAVVVADGIAFWMTPTGQFMMYSGGAVTPIECPLQIELASNLSFGQQEKIFASVVTYPGGKCIRWAYPDLRDGQEVSRYVELDLQSMSWAPGVLAWTAMAPSAVYPYPLSVDTGGNVYFAEKGSSANGSAISWSFKTAPFEVGNGDTMASVTRMIPDFDAITGGANFRLYGRMWPNDVDNIVGPFTLSAALLHADFVMAARQIALEYYGSSSPCAIRIGACRIDVNDTGMRI